MLYYLVELSDKFTVLNVFRYITFRTGGAMVTGALFVFLFGPWIIDHLRLRQGKGQPIRADGPQSHIVAKKGTPTMGGLMILSGLVVSTLLWANPLNPYVWIVLAVIGGLFVLEAVSVIVQVVSFKLTGKRVFKMAPIHHHYEQLGWKESTIVIRFWIIACILGLVGLSTLKLR